MKIAFITTNEMFYLPDAFSFFFEDSDQEDEFMVLIVPAEHRIKNNKTQKIAWRVLESFGIKEFTYLASKAIVYKILSKILPRHPGDYHYSIQSVCKSYQVPIHRINDINSSSTINLLKAWQTDLLISVSCPQLFKKDIINLASKGCLNLHCAPLPYYRGLYPAFWMLKNEEKEAGVTLFFVNEGVDAGDILLHKRFPILQKETLHSFLKISKKISMELLLEGIELIRKDQIKTTPIDETGGSYFSWPTASDVKHYKKKRKLR